MKNIFFFNKALVMLALGACSLAAPLVFPKIMNAQPVQESEMRPAVITENDKVLVHSLLKSSLLALNHANLANNYSVLRELGSPGFQTNNTSGDLADTFEKIREVNLDFAAIVEYDPVFDVEPTLDSQNNLRAKGYFPTSPRIEFNLLYQLVNGQFLVDVLTVGIQPTIEESTPSE